MFGYLVVVVDSVWTDRGHQWITMRVYAMMSNMVLHLYIIAACWLTIYMLCSLLMLWVHAWLLNGCCLNVLISLLQPATDDRTCMYCWAAAADEADVGCCLVYLLYLQSVFGCTYAAEWLILLAEQATAAGTWTAHAALFSKYCCMWYMYHIRTYVHMHSKSGQCKQAGCCRPCWCNHPGFISAKLCSLHNQSMVVFDMRSIC
jgi:hypothetical protein